MRCIFNEMDRVLLEDSTRVALDKTLVVMAVAVS